MATQIYWKRFETAAMSTLNRNALPPEEDALQLRTRVNELETEVGRLRASAGGTEIELQYREVFNNISVCMFLVDVTPGGRFKFMGFNPAEEKAVGLTSAEVSGRFVEDVFDADLAKKMIANYRRCLNLGKPIHYDDELNLPAGRRYFHSNLIPIQNTAGRIHRIVGACIDITDFRRTQDEAFARQKLTSLGTLAGGIAHDFNNLLGGVLSQAELALFNLAEGARPEEELKNIRAVAIRGAEIVRQLMAYAGQESDTLELVDVSRLVGESAELLNVMVSKRTAFRFLLGKEAPPVLVSPSKLRQILINLVTNAAEAIGDERDGMIEITTARIVVEPDPSAASSDLRAGDYLQLEVSDTGCGMTAETRAKIFDPFFTTKTNGRGLGLAIIHGIVNRLGGAITVLSEPDQGATFRILLPAARRVPIEQQHRDQTARKDRRATRGCILVVEDEELLRLAVSKMLRREEFTVLEAGSGTEALDLLRTHADDITLMLLDVTLPGISSTDVLRETKRLRPDLRVILASAYSNQRVAEVFAGFGPQPFLRKPYLLDDLLTSLEPEVKIDG